MFNGRRIEVRLAKDRPNELPPVVDEALIDEDAVKRLITHAVQAYTICKVVNLGCSMAEHLVVQATR